MRFKTLKMEGFLSYLNAQLELGDLAYASITGPNGSGKSAATQAITWALFGDARVDGDSDSVVSTEADRCTVSLVIEAQGEEWRVTRSKRRGKSASLQVELRGEGGKWERFGDHTNASAQKQIARLADMSPSAWRSLALLSADGGNQFVTAKPEDRRAILIELIKEASDWADVLARATERKRAIDSGITSGVSVRDSLKESIERAKNRRSLVEGDLSEIEPASSLEARRAALESELREMEGDSRQAILEEKLASLFGELDSREREWRTKASALEQELKSVRSLSARLSSARLKLAPLEEAIQGDREYAKISEEERIPRQEGLVAEMRELLDSASDEVELASALLSDLSARVSGLDERYEVVEGCSDDSSCYVCGAEMTSEKFSQVLEGIEQERADLRSQLEEARNRVDESRKLRSTAKVKLDEASRALSALKTDLASAKRDYAANERSLASVQADISSMECELEESRSEEEIEEEIESTNNSADSIRRDLEGKISAVERERDELDTPDVAGIRKRIRDIDSQTKRISALEGSIEELSKTIEDQSARLVEAERQLDKDRSDLEDVTFIVEASKPGGIPSMLIDGVLSEIESAWNEILASIPGGEHMRAEFRTEKIQKNGVSKPSLDIIVHDESGTERLLESFSSGERVRLTVSNMFAMAKVFSARHPGATGTIILDEPLGVLDIDAVPAFVDVLRSAISSGVAESILVVTHDRQVIEALPQTVMVRKTSDRGSVIEVHG